MDSPQDLSRRERQIMDVVYARGHSTVSEVLEGLPDPPSYSAVRALLAILEAKGHLRHERRKGKYVYLPTQPRENAGRQAMRRVLETFYDGSVEKAAVALLDASDAALTDEQAGRLASMIAQAIEEGR
jgi:predicted transcriptional regulator